MLSEKRKALFKTLTILVLALVLFAGVNLASESINGNAVFNLPTGNAFLDFLKPGAGNQQELLGRVTQPKPILFMKFEEDNK